jgi:hypothetical protein
MSFIEDAEIASLRIDKMSLHVVGNDGFESAGFNEVEHESFFVDRINETNISAVFEFNAESLTKQNIEKIARSEISFESGAVALAREFARMHGGSTRDGAFFVFELHTDNRSIRLYSLIKYDYRHAVARARQDEQGMLRLIVDAFIADRKAIQKSALIRVRSGSAEIHVSASDRARSQPDIGDYFAKYLDVTRALGNEELNERLIAVLTRTFKDCRSHLPAGGVPEALRRAKSILRDRQEISEDAIHDAVIAAAGNPGEEDVRSSLRNRASQRIRAEKLVGLAFPPDRHLLRKPPMRRVKTTEGVVLLYPDEDGGATVRRQSLEGGGEVITIRTDRVEEDVIVSGKNR